MARCKLEAGCCNIDFTGLSECFAKGKCLGPFAIEKQEFKVQTGHIAKIDPRTLGPFEPYVTMDVIDDFEKRFETLEARIKMIECSIDKLVDKIFAQDHD